MFMTVVDCSILVREVISYQLKHCTEWLDMHTLPLLFVLEHLQGVYLYKSKTKLPIWFDRLEYNDTQQLQDQTSGSNIYNHYSKCLDSSKTLTKRKCLLIVTFALQVLI